MSSCFNRWASASAPMGSGGYCVAISMLLLRASISPFANGLADEVLEDDRPHLEADGVGLGAGEEQEIVDEPSHSEACDTIRSSVSR